MRKTPEELEEYIFQYKNKTLNDINNDMQKHFDLSNSVDLKLGTELLTLSSAFVAIIGGFILSQNHTINTDAKNVITGMVVLFLISIIAGLKNYDDIAKFWKAIAQHKHSEGKLINQDESKTFDDLVKLKTEVESYRSKAPHRSNIFARRIQVWTFIGGIVLLLILVIIKIYS